jgi:hypothetical protein
MHEMRYADLGEGVHLRLDEDQQLDAGVAFGGWLAQPPAQAWAGVRLPPRTVLADLDLWLAARLTAGGHQFVVLTARQEAVDAGVTAPGWRFGTPAGIVGDPGLARARTILADGTRTVTRQRLDAAHRRIDQQQRPHYAEYDACRDD